MRKLNIGCGAVIATGWVNVDRLQLAAPSEDRFVHGDLLEGLPFDDGHFDGILANHSLQQLYETELDKGLTELRRLLRPGGILRVLVPDVTAAFNAWDAGHRDWPGFIANHAWDLDRELCHYLTQGGTNRVTFTPSTLAARLAANGFDRRGAGATTLDWSELTELTELDTRLGESIVLNAQ